MHDEEKTTTTSATSGTEGGGAREAASLDADFEPVRDAFAALGITATLRHVDEAARRTLLLPVARVVDVDTRIRVPFGNVPSAKTYGEDLARRLTGEPLPTPPVVHGVTVDGIVAALIDLVADAVSTDELVGDAKSYVLASVVEALQGDRLRSNVRDLVVEAVKLGERNARPMLIATSPAPDEPREWRDDPDPLVEADGLVESLLTSLATVRGNTIDRPPMATAARLRGKRGTIDALREDARKAVDAFLEAWALDEDGFAEVIVAVERRDDEARVLVSVNVRDEAGGAA